jgi:hypothetical protein
MWTGIHSGFGGGPLTASGCTMHDSQCQVRDTGAASHPRRKMCHSSTSLTSRSTTAPVVSARYTASVCLHCLHMRPGVPPTSQCHPRSRGGREGGQGHKEADGNPRKYVPTSGGKGVTAPRTGCPGGPTTTRRTSKKENGAIPWHAASSSLGQPSRTNTLSGRLRAENLKSGQEQEGTGVKAHTWAAPLLDATVNTARRLRPPVTRTTLRLSTSSTLRSSNDTRAASSGRRTPRRDGSGTKGGAPGPGTADARKASATASLCSSSKAKQEEFFRRHNKGRSMPTGMPPKSCPSTIAIN